MERNRALEMQIEEFDFFKNHTKLEKAKEQDREPTPKTFIEWAVMQMITILICFLISAATILFFIVLPNFIINCLFF
ncbi:TPA: hypothetical protein QDB51_002682 [Burkholderia vietnamiensis]|nr:hypothetical protein [Burkholderia vietnamiensis]